MRQDALPHFRRIGQAVLEDDEGLDLLHLERIRHTDDAAALHGGMTFQDVLDLGRIDIVAVGDDHALDALAEVDEALLVHQAQVPGVEPDVAVRVAAQRLGILLFVVDVADHHRRAGQADLTLFPVGELVAGTGLADLVIGVRIGQADAAFLFLVVRSQAAGGHTFGSAVTFPHADAGVVVGEETVELLLQFDGERVSAGEYAPQAGKVRPVEIGIAGDGFEERRDTGDEGRPGLPDQARVTLDIETGYQDGRASADEHRMDAHAQAEAMEDRHRSQHAAVTDHLMAHRRGLAGQGVEVHVGEHDALGHARRPAGEEHHGLPHRVLLHRIAVRNRRAGGDEMLPQQHAAVLDDLRELALGHQLLSQRKRERQLLGDAGDDQLADGTPLLDIQELGIELVQGHRIIAGGLVHVMDDLADGGERMDHRRDGSDAVQAIEAIDGLGHVGQADQDTSARADAQRVEGTGRPLHFFHERPVWDLAAHEGQGREVRIGSCRGQHGAAHGQFGVIQMERNLTVASEPGRGDVIIVEGHLGTGIIRIRPAWRQAGPAARDGRRDGGPDAASWRNNSRPRCARPRSGRA